MHVSICRETVADIPAIREIHLAAFGNNAEANLVDQLRAEGHAHLSLVATGEDCLVGHIFFSQLHIDVIPALALAPMAVKPGCQRRGIGSRLVEEGLQQAREAGHRIVLVLGHPEFYPRFGFSAELAEPLQSPYAGEAFMALELETGALNGIDGQVRYPPPFAAM